MAGEWRKVTFGEIAETLPGKYIPASEYDPDGRFVIYGSNSIMGRAREPLYTGPIIVFARIGSNCGATMFSPAPCWINNNAAGIRGRPGADTRFLFYWMRYFDFSRVREGSGQPYISQRTLDAQIVHLPPLPEQRAIAHILGTLDDKLELNRRMSETLEAMARALFQSWFVDFDPVRENMKRKGTEKKRKDAKAQRRKEEGSEFLASSRPGGFAFPPHILDLFPARLVDSELGEIPEGWEVGRVDDEFDLTMGQSPPGETYNETGEGMPFYQGRADFGARFPKRRVYCTAPTRLATKNDTLISVRAPVGDINMAGENCAIGRGVAAARHKSGSRSYTYQFMLGLEEVFARFEAEGTVFGSISKKDFHAIPCVVPPPPVIRAFEALLDPVDSRIEMLARETETLAALRDALLPKLISGELRVKDAEKFIGRVL